MSKRPVYCWDTCVVIAHIKQEQDKPLDDMRAIAVEIDTDKADMIVSVTTTSEFDDIVDNKILSDEYYGFLSRPNVQLIDINPPVADKVRIIRNRASKSTPKRNIKVPDAQIVATAILYGADVLHTFDERLLGLSLSPIVDCLSIKKPCLLSGQKLLQYSVNHRPVKLMTHFQRNETAAHFGRPISLIESVNRLSLALR